MSAAKACFASLLTPRPTSDGTPWNLPYDPDPQVAETATRIRARKPPGWPTSQRERQGH